MAHLTASQYVALKAAILADPALAAQTPVAATLTLTMPANTAAAALLRIA